MNYPLTIAALAVVAAIALWRRAREQALARAEAPAEPASEAAPDGEAVEMEAVFMDKAAAGSVPYKLLSVGGQYDLMLIKSLFQSEQIPFYVEFERMASLKPGIHIGDYNDAGVYVLEEDYDDALAVADAYCSRKGDEPAPGAASKVRNVAECLLAGWYVPKDPANRIVVFRKP